MMKLVGCIHEDKGATAIEYALIAGLIALVIITAVSLLGQDVKAMFDAAGETF